MVFKNFFERRQPSTSQSEASSGKDFNETFLGFEPEMSGALDRARKDVAKAEADARDAEQRRLEEDRREYEQHQRNEFQNNPLGYNMADIQRQINADKGLRINEQDLGGNTSASPVEYLGQDSDEEIDLTPERYKPNQPVVEYLGEAEGDEEEIVIGSPENGISIINVSDPKYKARLEEQQQVVADQIRKEELEATLRGEGVVMLESMSSEEKQRFNWLAQQVNKGQLDNLSPADQQFYKNFTRRDDWDWYTRADELAAQDAAVKTQEDWLPPGLIKLLKPGKSTAMMDLYIQGIDRRYWSGSITSGADGKDYLCYGIQRLSKDSFGIVFVDLETGAEYPETIGTLNSYNQWSLDDSVVQKYSA